jgi:uncharacterized protein (DUF488 family)
MEKRVFTIGHSNHAIEAFVALLRLHVVTAVGDVRSAPYSRYNPQFNRENLAESLRAAGISYVFLGAELGARRENPACYEDGRVKFDRVAETAQFRGGLERVSKGAEEFRLALMCAEKEPLECHRTILVSRHVEELGIGVTHIHADGLLESHVAAMERLRKMLKLPERDMFRSYEQIIVEAYGEQEERVAYRASDDLNEEQRVNRAEA